MLSLVLILVFASFAFCRHDQDIDILPNEPYRFTSRGFPAPTPPSSSSELYRIWSVPNSEIHLNCNFTMPNGQCSHQNMYVIPVGADRDSKLIKEICKTTPNYSFVGKHGILVVQYVVKSEGGNSFECEAISKIESGKKYPEFLNDKYVEPNSAEFQTNDKSTGMTCNCGKRNRINAANRIIFGKETAVNEYTWMITQLYKYPNNKYQHFCGGSIITNRHIVTAAHCISKDIMQYVVIRVGEHNLNDDTETTATELYEIEDVLSHELYEDGKHEGDPNYVKNYQYDIAIIVVKRDIRFNDFVGPACLPKASVPVGEYIKAIGWGATTDDVENSGSPVLLEVYQKVLALENCNYSGNKINTTHVHQVCHFYKGGKATCGGDSGSPLFWHDKKTNKYTVVALTSFGLPHCSANFPSVSSDVAAFIPWIKEKIKESGYERNICTPV